MKRERHSRGTRIDVKLLLLMLCMVPSTCRFFGPQVGGETGRVPPSAMEWSVMLSLDPSERLDGLTMNDANAVRAGLAAALKPTFGDLDDDDIDPVWQVATLTNVDKDGQVVLGPETGACLILSGVMESAGDDGERKVYKSGSYLLRDEVEGLTAKEEASLVVVPESIRAMALANPLSAREDMEEEKMNVDDAATSSEEEGAWAASRRKRGGGNAAAAPPSPAFGSDGVYGILSMDAGAAIGLSDEEDVSGVPMRAGRASLEGSDVGGEGSVMSGAYDDDDDDDMGGEDEDEEEGEFDDDDVEIVEVRPAPARMDDGDSKTGKRRLEKKVKQEGGEGGKRKGRSLKRSRPNKPPQQQQNKSEKKAAAGDDEEDGESEGSEAWEDFEDEEVDDPDIGFRPTRERYLPQRSASAWKGGMTDESVKSQIVASLRQRLGDMLSFNIVPIVDLDKNVLNPQYDHLRDLMQKAPEIIVYHGTTRNNAKQIAQDGFDPRAAAKRNSVGNNHMFFATDPRIADSYAKPWPMKVKHGGCYQKNIIVSRIIMSQDSHVTVTGCTGGTVKVHEKSLNLVRPIFRVTYYIRNPKRKLKLGFQGKENLELEPGVLDHALKRHLITISKAQVQDFMRFAKT